MKQRRFLMLSDDEVYILKRAFVESAQEFSFTGSYADILMHNRLLNEIIDEIKYRQGEQE